MNRKHVIALLAALVAVSAAIFWFSRPEGRGNAPNGGADFHIGIVTGSLSQSRDGIAGAQAFRAKYGGVSDGGVVKVVTFPDNFTESPETISKIIEDFGKDSLMKLVVVSEGVPGTAEGVRRLKAARPDVLCFVSSTHEDLDDIASVADLVVETDFVARGYVLPLAAKRLGCDTFVHVSIPRHMQYDTIRRRRQVMKAACGELGLKFADEEAPDPTGEAGLEGARGFIFRIVPDWIAKYGKKTAFFCTNDAHAAPLLQQIAAYGGVFMEGDLPSLYLGYPEAFGLDLSKTEGDWEDALKIVETAATRADASGRLATWVSPFGYTTAAGLSEFGKMVVEKNADLSDRKALIKCFDEYSRGAAWRGSPHVDETGAPVYGNVYLVFNDTYVIGVGYMKMTKVDVPTEYFKYGASIK